MIKIIQQKDFIDGIEGGRKIAVSHRELRNGYDKLNLIICYSLQFQVSFADPLLLLLMINVLHILYTICVIVFLNFKTTLSPAIEDDKVGASRY